MIVLDRRPRLRATQTLNGHRYLLGYYRDPQELTEHCDLADLVEVIDLPRSSGRAATVDINRRRQRPRPFA